MPVESANYIHQLNPSYPPATDPAGEACAHLRLIKSTLKGTFPNIDKPVTATAEQLNGLFVMPVGAIVPYAFDEASVPAGWALCDGRTVARTDGTGNITTPDLRNRFILGAGTAALLSTGGATSSTADTSEAGAHGHTASSAGNHTHGGSTSGHALTVAEMPQHDHLLVADEKVGSTNLSNNNYLARETSAGGDTEYHLRASSQNPTLGATSKTGSGQAHSHGIAADGGHVHDISAVGDHKHSVTVATVPPYIALNWIMKV